MRCSACGKEMPASDLAFCPYCGKQLEKPAENSEPEQAVSPMEEETHRQMMKDLLQARQQTNLFKRKDLLLALREKFPDCFEVEKELLKIGHPRASKKGAVDYFIIKCYLLEIYLHPDRFTDEVRSSCRQEIFGDEQLQKCMTLSGKGEGFLEEYTRHLCTDYVELFLQGSSEYGRSVFGLFKDRHPEQTLAKPVCYMLGNILSDEQMEEEQKHLLARSLYCAFSNLMGGKTVYLDAALSDAGIRF